MTTTQPGAVEHVVICDLCSDLASGFTFDGKDIVGTADVRALQRALFAEQARRTMLEIDAAIAGYGDSPLKRWRDALGPLHEVSDGELRGLSNLVGHFGFTAWTEQDAVWLLDRARSGDWKMYGRTRTEAVILYLGPERIAREAGPDAVRALSTRYPELFDTEVR